MAAQSFVRSFLLAAGLAAACLAGPSLAAPANPSPVALTQPDGTAFTATPRGDEWLNWFETGGGELLVFNRTAQRYEYAAIAVVDDLYRLQPSGLAFGGAPLLQGAPIVTPAELSRAWRDARRAAGVGLPSTETAALAAPSAQVQPAEFKTLLVLVDFTDISIQSGDAAWQGRVFGGYPGNVTPGTVNDYFREVGDGQAWFTPAEESYAAPGDGIVRVRLNQPHPQLAKQMSSWRPVLYQALQAADGFVDFNSFDRNGDGSLHKDELQIGFVVAGLESAWNGSEDQGLWAHAWSFPDDAVAYPPLDGVRVAKGAGRYFAVGERHGHAGNSWDATIGIIAHELGHSAFYLPDLYQEPYNVSMWGLMGLGSWGSRSGEPSGTTPTHMLAFSKISVSLPSGRGFLQPTLIVPAAGATRVDLYHALDTARHNVVRIDSPSNGQYFLLEHRRVQGYDEGLQRQGMRNGDGGVLVSYALSSRELGLYRADGSTGGARGSQLFFLGNVDRLAPDTSPSSDTPHGVYTGLVLERFSAPGEIMSLELRHQAEPCRQYSATNSQHVGAGRAYSQTSGSWWFKKTEYFAYGSNASLGSSGYTTTVLREVRQGYFEPGECPGGLEVDTVAPVITLNGSAEMQVELGATFVDPGATASDDRDGDISARIVVSGAVDTGVAGTYLLRYNVSDAAGNAAAEVRRTVRVEVAAACVEHRATVQGHINAGRATQCGGWNLYGCAVGSGSNIGSRFGYAEVVLREAPAGYYDSGACP